MTTNPTDRLLETPAAPLNAMNPDRPRGQRCCPAPTILAGLHFAAGDAPKCDARSLLAFSRPVIRKTLEVSKPAGCASTIESPRLGLDSLTPERPARAGKGVDALAGDRSPCLETAAADETARAVKMCFSADPTGTTPDGLTGIVADPARRQALHCKVC